MWLTTIILIFYPPIHGANIIDIDVVKTGQTLPVDQIEPGVDHELRIHVENEADMAGMSIGFQVWSPDGASWAWTNVGGYGQGGLGLGKACVTVNPGCRIDPPLDHFDLTGFLVTERNVDETGRDSIMVGGVSMMNTVSAGALEHMISLHFTADAEGSMLCFDSAFIPPYGDFMFVEATGYAVYPSVGWSSGGQCWPIGSGTGNICTNSTSDPAFVVCPGGDEPFRVYLKDEFGDPIVGETDIWVEFFDCSIIQPCPASSQLYTTLYPVGPSDDSGVVTFYMDGGGCDNACSASVKTSICTIATVPVKALDVTGDFGVSILNDFEFSLCNDYNGDGLINHNDVNTFSPHAGHHCEMDPCERFGYEFTLDPESNLMPGQTISLDLDLSNNSFDTCIVNFVSFYSSPYGTGTDEELIQGVIPDDSLLAPGDETTVSVPYVIPDSGHGCVHARFTTNCCSTMVELTQCFQSLQHCTPGINVCYELNIQLDSVPVMDTVWHRFVELGWAVTPVHTPTFPLYSPDSIVFLICTPNLSDLGDSTVVIVDVCFDENCMEFQEFENRVVITSQTGDANSDCFINVGDAVFLINYVFKFGDEPEPIGAGDANCDGDVNVGDAVKIINYVFKGGLPPCFVE
jgi:hypothetical protein